MQKHLLLLIEDNPLLTGLYKTAFEKEGFTVLVSHDGQGGLQIAKEKKPEVILLDYLMSGMNGLQVLENLKTDPATKNITVIMLSVSGDEDKKNKAKELGAKDYMVKSDLSVGDIVKNVTDLIR